MMYQCIILLKDKIVTSKVIDSIVKYLIDLSCSDIMADILKF